MYDLERPAACSVGRAMDILGERWTFLILRESFYGVRRFSDMQRNLGIARNILSGRLQTRWSAPGSWSAAAIRRSPSATSTGSPRSAATCIRRSSRS